MLNRKLLFSAAAAAFLAGCATQSDSIVTNRVSVFQSSENLKCADGNVQLSRTVEKLFYDDFQKQDDSKWEPFTNFEKLLKTEYGEYKGVKGFVLTKDKSKKGTDTAFEMISKPFAVEPESTFTLNIIARGTVDMILATGHMKLYHNNIIWFDKDGKELEEPFKFRYKVKNSMAFDNRIVGKVPPNAVKAVIHIGADGPNIGPDAFVCYMKVAFESASNTAKLYKQGEFVSSPIFNPGTEDVKVNASTPQGTSVKVLVSTSEDKNGSPAGWSSFREPDKNAAAAKPWLRYKLVLSGTEDITPVVYSVKVGQKTESNWSGNDMDAPVISRVSAFSNPDASAPVQFKVTDNASVDWSTFSIRIDDDDVTANVTRSGDIVTFKPAAPLVPEKSDFSKLNAWKLVSNHVNAITFTPLKEKANAWRVTREGSQIDSSFIISSPIIQVKAGNEYTFSIEERTTVDFERGEPKNAPFKINWLDNAGKLVGEEVRCYFVSKNANWKKYSFKHKAPENAKQVKVTLGFDSPNIFEEAFIDFANPSIEGAAVSTIEETKPNFHTFTIAASDFSGNKNVKECFYLIDSNKSIAPKATIRKDGAILIDNKPFFPIGVYAVCKREFNNNDFDKAFADLKAGGFNLAHTYGSGRGPVFTDFMETAQKYGFKLFIASGASANCMNIKRYLSDVINERNHPAVLSWYLADDTASHVSFDDLRELHEAIHDVDDKHLTSQADPVGSPEYSRYKHYVNSTDIFLPEIYPVRKGMQKDAAVPTVIEDMKTIQADLAAAGNPAKSIWPIIQYFDGWGSWERFPTFDELHAMSFLSIIHGGMGITWYTYGGFGKNHGVTATPETWANICKVATELKALENVFLTECYEKNAYQMKVTAGAQKDALGFDSISVLFKRIGDRQYLVCANSANADVTAEFQAKASTGNVWFENRSFTLDNGVFRDTFKPYAVHVYELK